MVPVVKVSAAVGTGVGIFVDICPAIRTGNCGTFLIIEVIIAIVVAVFVPVIIIFVIHDLFCYAGGRRGFPT